MLKNTFSFCLFICFYIPNFAVYAEGLISSVEREGYTLLHSRSKPAQIHFHDKDHEVVKIAAKSLAADFHKVSGKAATLQLENKSRRTAIYIGSLDQSELVNDIVKSLSLDMSAIQGKWESFQIQVVDDPNNPGSSAVLIVGSDRRGTAYAVYELSQAMGVSPWHWWADVAPKKTKKLYISQSRIQFGPPSVKYRGIFINDEDWGLHPWASQTFDPELGDIGPKTYQQVFDLLLRLKANTLWPAMHKVSSAFNEIAENKVLADRYAIVMASSHAEPMLRNNVREWKHPKSEFNYATHSEKVLDYWDSRLQQNAKFENVYSLGMRGVHDSGMSAGSNAEEKSQFLEKIIQDQRQLLKKYKSQALEDIPQVFTPYKEVLTLYRNGLKVPEDVTLVWPDDNHGYIRRFTSKEERARSGGGGVYYHTSYLGAPMAYLWLNSTPPSLVWEEMQRAYSLGAQEYWILNVGDIKPAEIGIEIFMQMGWDIERWNIDNQHKFLQSWAEREFTAAGDDIAKIMQGYFALNYQRKPEHLQWWLPHSRSRGSDLSKAEIRQRLSAFELLLENTAEVRSKLDSSEYDSFFQLVEYPVLASAAANQRFFHLEQYARWFHEELSMAKAHGRRAIAADKELAALTRKYNEEISAGKWRGIMNVEPADNLWRSFRQSPEPVPSAELVAGDEPEELVFKGAFSQGPDITLQAEDFQRSAVASEQEWKVVRNLGRAGDSIGLYPIRDYKDTLVGFESNSPYVEYKIDVPESNNYQIEFQLLPTFPVSEDIGLRLAYAIPGILDQASVIELKRKSKSKEWAQDVLRASTSIKSEVFAASEGDYTLRLYGIDSGVIVDRILIYRVNKPGQP